jgi:ATP-dependent DNA helicase RecG
LIGTHALLEDKGEISKLEAQQLMSNLPFWGESSVLNCGRKNEIPPHILVMTATPIRERWR